MDNPAPRVIQPIRVGPEKEQGGKEGGGDQNFTEQSPLPIVVGIHFLMSPLYKESFHTILTSYILILYSDKLLPAAHFILCPPLRSLKC